MATRQMPRRGDWPYRDRDYRWDDRFGRGYDRWYDDWDDNDYRSGQSLMRMMMEQTRLLRAIDRTTRQIDRTTRDTNRLVRGLYEEEPEPEM